MSFTLIHLAEVDSTQAFLRRHPELRNCAVMADAQTEGRGRQGNTWISTLGAGLWMSAALPVPALPPGLVLQRAMAAVISVLPTAGLGLKWPNDLVAWHQGRLVKLGGIIGERAGERLILGLGLNLETSPELPERAIPAASLADLGLPPAQPLALARSILEAWEDLESAPEPAFRWPENGEPIVWEEGQGACLGWEEDGRLKVATVSGIQRLSAAEVRGLR